MSIKKIPMRTCIGCQEKKPKNDMVRVAFYEGNLEVDRTGKAKGRGVYLCDNCECIKTAVKKKAFNRCFKTNFNEEAINKVVEELTLEDKEC
jgi:hypothetical protein